jgi:hypothetical protein
MAVSASSRCRSCPNAAGLKRCVISDVDKTKCASLCKEHTMPSGRDWNVPLWLRRAVSTGRRGSRNRTRDCG